MLSIHFCALTRVAMFPFSLAPCVTLLIHACAFGGRKLTFDARAALEITFVSLAARQSVQSGQAVKVENDVKTGARL